VTLKINKKLDQNHELMQIVTQRNPMSKTHGRAATLTGKTRFSSFGED
jgi:hypothetical protein